MLDFVIFAVTFLAVLIIAIIWLYPGSKTVTTIPGLSPSSTEDGNLGDIARAGSLHEFLVDIHSRFGPITGFWWEQTYIVSIASPELAKEHHNVFDRPPMLFKSFEIFIGSKSIQYANGAEGRSRRRQYDQVFSHDRMPNYMHHFNEIAKETETKWLQKGQDDHISLSEETFSYAMRTALMSMFGNYFSDVKAVLKFQKCYERVWSDLEYDISNPGPRDEKRQEQLDKDLDFMKSVIKEVIAYRKKSESHIQGQHLIDLLIDYCPDEATLMADAISFLVGGFHTTSNVILWAVYFLATHKDIQNKLYKEVKSIIGHEGKVDENNFSDFVYMIQVIDETLRCAVVAPWAARFQDFDSELGGHKIPKNTPVIHALGVMMQDEKLWPLPNKFDPERFSPENRKKMSTYAFVPFGFAGKRKCPGYRFAYWDTVVFLASVIQRFDISLCEDQMVKPVYGLVTHPHDEIWIKVNKRK